LTTFLFPMVKQTEKIIVTRCRILYVIST